MENKVGTAKACGEGSSTANPAQVDKKSKQAKSTARKQKRKAAQGHKTPEQIAAEKATARARNIAKQQEAKVKKDASRAKAEKLKAEREAANLRKVKEDAERKALAARPLKMENREGLLAKRHKAMEKLAKQLFPFWFWYRHLIRTVDKQITMLEGLLARSELEEGQEARVDGILCACELAKNKVKSIQSQIRIDPTLRLPPKTDMLDWDSNDEDGAADVTIMKEHRTVKKHQEIEEAKKEIRFQRNKLTLEATLSQVLHLKLAELADMNNLSSYITRTPNHDFLDQKRPNIESNIKKSKIFVVDALLAEFKRLESESRIIKAGLRFDFGGPPMQILQQNDA
ncbi:hypothetical protein DL98DRAFT_603415 [Cadophora sp. DSE1049]|nr:hypothetical protein DL98DRAFT_603415 [Cadophora sp. DSE1049]